MMNLDVRTHIGYFHLRWSKCRKKPYIPKLSHLRYIFSIVVELKAQLRCAFFVPKKHDLLKKPVKSCIESPLSKAGFFVPVR